MKAPAYNKNRKGAWIFARLKEYKSEHLLVPELKRLVLPYPGIVLGHNEITPGFSNLIARLCLQNDEPGGGLLYAGVGSGDGSWDPLNPPAPTGNETGMVSEFFRKSWSAAYFVDEFGTPQTVAAAIAANLNTVDFEVSFSEGEAVGLITELGIWGGDATATLGSGSLCDYETIAGIPKPANATLSFIFRWTF